MSGLNKLFSFLSSKKSDKSAKQTRQPPKTSKNTYNAQQNAVKYVSKTAVQPKMTAAKSVNPRSIATKLVGCACQRK